MLINEVCKKCQLTKKAIEYYEKQGLVQPEILENGYRNYSDKDIALLEEVAMLRKLDISIEDIKAIIASENKYKALADYKIKMEQKVQKMRIQYECFNHLIDSGYDVEKVKNVIEQKLDENMMIKDKLLQAFPGNYGLFLSVYFGRFLNEKINNPDKVVAYQRIIHFFDTLENIEFPKELEDYLLEAFYITEKNDFEKMTDSIHDAVNDFSGYMEEHSEEMEAYLKFRLSDEYKSTSAYELQQLLLQFQQAVGYYEIFIPNLKILSKSYAEYQSKLHLANEAFLNKFPQANNMGYFVERDK